MGIWEELREYLDERCRRMHLAGVSACIRGPEGILFEYAQGRIREDGRKPDGDTVFGIASMSKSITALCLCLLEQEGKLSLEDPVTRYVPDFRVPGQPSEAVTIRHLCMHASGLPPVECLEWSSAAHSGRKMDPDTEELMKHAPSDMGTIEEILDYLRTCPYPTTGAPGEQMSYSNEGYAVLSYVVDAAAGEPLESYMKRRVFEPLGMTRTMLDNRFEESRAMAGENFTSLYCWDGERHTCDDDWTIIPPFRGCAMVKSTARDMAAYYQALAAWGVHEGRQVLPREAVEKLIGKYHPLSSQQTMCLGLYKRETAGHVLCEHSGGLYGVSTKGGLLLDEGIGFSVLSNQSDESMDSLMYAMVNALAGRPIAESREWYVPSGQVFSCPDMLSGTYACHEGTLSEIRVWTEAGELRAEKNGTPLKMVHCGQTRFQGLDTDGSLYTRLEFVIRDGTCIGVRSASRMFARV